MKSSYEIELGRKKETYNFEDVPKWRRRAGDRRGSENYPEPFFGSGSEELAAGDRREKNSRRHRWLRVLSKIVYPRAFKEKDYLLRDRG